MLQLPWYSLTGIVLIFQLLVPASARADETANAPSLARGPRLVPIGETDSEHAFCHLLENISRHFHEPSKAGVAPWFTALAALERVDLRARQIQFPDFRWYPPHRLRP